LITKIRVLTRKEHNVFLLGRPIDVFSVEKKMAVYFENFIKQANMMWLNWKFIFRVKRVGKQIIFKLD
jgi:hypothetical protein